MFLFQRLKLSLGLIGMLLLSACGASTAAPVIEDVVFEPVTVAAEAADPILIEPVAQVDDPVIVASVSGQLQEIYSRVSPSVVHIQTNGGQGSGFVWDTNGHIVTNHHVIEGASSIFVGFSNGRDIRATVVGTDPDSDLAVLRVDAPLDLLLPVEVADSTLLTVGDLAIAIGNPFGQEGTMTSGIVSALGRLVPVDSGSTLGGRFNVPDMIQTDAAINPGNSGGVLLDGDGRLIGVTSQIVSPVRGSSGIGFAIPTSLVNRIVPELIATGDYEHPFLGISGVGVSPQVAEAMGLPASTQGVMLAQVSADGPAGRAGLEASTERVTIDGQTALVGGDIIISAGGRPVADMDDLISDLSRFGTVGENYEVTVLRDGSPISVNILIQARP